MGRGKGGRRVRAKWNLTHCLVFANGLLRHQGSLCYGSCTRFRLWWHNSNESNPAVLLARGGYRRLDAINLVTANEALFRKRINTAARFAQPIPHPVRLSDRSIGRYSTFCTADHACCWPGHSIPGV